jgi:UDP-N-acetylglucosamine--N-acetylmuramyl-(pentapeptide) pyrophosphoryl-undecaprenol N-acetylglucosamine transferase
MSVLLVCSGGGHLKQLHALVDRTPFADDERLWVTFDTGLSRDLLRDQQVEFATYAAPRDVPNIARNALHAARLLRGRRFTHAVSTGSSLAVDFLPLAAARGSRCSFVETAARATGPSLTGRIMQRVPGVRTYTQYPSWASRRWVYAGSVFDAFEPGPDAGPRPVRRAVVTLGTTESYGFERLVHVLRPLLDGAQVLWQTGSTPAVVRGARADVPHAELRAAIAEADVVVAHAGTGAALTAMELGRCAVLVPRRAVFDEHVDDHQVQIARELARRGLAVHCEADALSTDVLQRAAGRTVLQRTEQPLLDLAG